MITYMTDSSNSGAQIRAYVERINKLREERDAASADIADVLAEAKGNGFNKALIKKLAEFVAKPADKRAQAERDGEEFDLMLTAYRNAGGA